MENASYPVGTCAERCALSTAVVSGVVFLFLLLICVGSKSDQRAHTMIEMILITDGFRSIVVAYFVIFIIQGEDYIFSPICFLYLLSGIPGCFSTPLHHPVLTITVSPTTHTKCKCIRI